MSSTTFRPQATLIYAYFTRISSFILSHPLYFLYLIFFLPYALKTLSFLSPLFITTSFILLVLVLGQSNSAFHVIRQNLSEKFGFDSQEACPDLEECEAYKIVFAFDTQVSDMVEHLTGEEYFLQSFDDKEVVYDLVEPAKSSDSQFVEEKRLQDFFDVVDDFDDDVVEKNVDLISTKSIEVVEEDVDESKLRQIDDPVIVKSGKVVEENADEAKDVNVIGGNNGGHTRKVVSLGKPFSAEGIIDSGEYNSNLGSYGSMRREKEWKRTLACKLFEERHNAVVEGDERIDALWERHESDELSKSMRMASETNKKSVKKSSIMSFYGDVEEEEEEEGDDDNEEFEIRKAQLCCLQAFKFSAGKMNLGMRRPNLVKFSKALKGFGWLHSAKRHGRKEKA